MWEQNGASRRNARSPVARYRLRDAMLVLANLIELVHSDEPGPLGAGIVAVAQLRPVGVPRKAVGCSEDEVDRNLAGDHGRSIECGLTLVRYLILSWTCDSVTLQSV